MASLSAFPMTNQQEDSRLMQLPQELRDHIYAHLFCSTRVAFGERAYDRIETRRIISALPGKPLTVLRSCRRIRHEIGNEWLHQVRFHFESPESMLDKLANLPLDVRSQIRHVRVSGDPLFLSTTYDDIFYRTAQVLKLLPGLRLDVLTVLATRGPEVSYETLDMLIRHGNGWQQLRYIAHDSTMLGYGYNLHDPIMSDPLTADDYLRQPQPADWQRALENRDGESTNPSVRIWRSQNVATPCAILRPSERVDLVQGFAARQTSATYGKTEDQALMRPGEREKEVMVIVKRGAGVDYAEREGSPYLSVGDIRQHFEGKPWKDIKAEEEARIRAYDEDFRFRVDDDEFHGTDSDEEYDESSSDDVSDGESNPFKRKIPTFVDTYRHVDDYEWPPLHFLKE